MKKKIFFGLLLVVAVLVIWNWSLLVYGLRMGVGQLTIVWNARPVEEFLNDHQFPDSLKAKLLLVGEARRFAIDSLGLRDTKNYKKLYDQQGKELMWVVQACEPFSLDPVQWKFPVVGSVPYKGFFDQASALAEQKKLQAQGLDVSVRNPGGWSTLGWFTDPILSDMLLRSEGDLAELIIHEMVHATIFVKDSTDFNENLASFIGDTAAYHFLAHKYGKHSMNYQSYVNDVQDYRLYYNHILRGTRQLDSLYASFTSGQSDSTKLKSKEQMIRRIVTTIDTLSLHQPRKRSISARLPNNTFFMSYRLYHARKDDFKDLLHQRFKGDLKKFIEYFSQAYPFL